jgi:hypothetical protein
MNYLLLSLGFTRRKLASKRVVRLAARNGDLGKQLL